MNNCTWFRCWKTFEPSRCTTRFCSAQCRADEKNWRQMRGAPLVKLMLPWRQSRNWSKVQRKAWEAEHNRSVPSIADIARLVDAMTAEMKEGRAR